MTTNVKPNCAVVACWLTLALAAAQGQTAKLSVRPDRPNLVFFAPHGSSGGVLGEFGGSSGGSSGDITLLNSRPSIGSDGSWQRRLSRGDNCVRPEWALYGRRGWVRCHPINHEALIVARARTT